MSGRRKAEPPPPDPGEQVRALRREMRETLEQASHAERKELFSTMGDSALYAPVFFTFAAEGAAMPPLETLAPPPRTYQPVSAGTYLVRERGAAYRSEYYDGEVVAMAGASERHESIAQNISAHLYFRLDAQCRVYQSDLKVAADAGAKYLYPDVMVICGGARFADRARDVVTNPTVVFEVLSPATERKDRTRKAQAYRGIPSLAAYVLVSQRQTRVEVYERGTDGEWACTLYQHPDACVPLPTIGCELLVSEIYRNVLPAPVPARG